MDTSSPPNHHRGAPPGNQNARKHGLTPRQPRLPSIPGTVPPLDLSPEITLMRHHLSYLNDDAVTSFMPDRLEKTRLFLLAMASFTRLVRVQAFIYACGVPSSDLDQQSLPPGCDPSQAADSPDGIDPGGSPDPSDEFTAHDNERDSYYDPYFPTRYPF